MTIKAFAKQTAISRPLATSSCSAAKRQIAHAYHTITAFARTTVSPREIPSRPTTTAHGQPRCQLFKLPPELRNYVYDLVFATPPVADLVDACPPQKNLPLTCRRIYAETSEMYKAAYRFHWRNTVFIIDVFVGQRGIEQLNFIGSGEQTQDDASELAPKKPEPRQLNRRKRADVYAKVREMDEEDVGHIENVRIFTQDRGRTWALGDFEDGMWTAYAASPGGSRTKLIQYFPPAARGEALKDAGFEVAVVWSSKTHRQVFIDVLPWDRVMEAKAIIGRQGLSKEELMAPLRIAALDFLYDAAA